MIEALDAPVAIVCPAFPTNLRTIYRGHLFVGDKLLNESGMEKHPLTPMTDANLQRWLSYQSQNRIGLITWIPSGRVRRPCVPRWQKPRVARSGWWCAMRLPMRIC